MYIRSKERGKQMAKIIARRMAMLVLVMVGVSIVTFFVARVIPGNPALLIAGPRATPEMLAGIRADLGLDQPLIVQYVGYMRDLLQGDLGASIMTGKSVGPELFRYMPALPWLAFRCRHSGSACCWFWFFTAGWACCPAAVGWIQGLRHRLLRQAFTCLTG
jgi:hypothetical protein